MVTGVNDLIGWARFSIMCSLPSCYWTTIYREGGHCCGTGANGCSGNSRGTSCDLLVVDLVLEILFISFLFLFIPLFRLILKSFSCYSYP